MDSTTQHVIADLSEVDDLLVIYATRNIVLTEIDFTKRITDMDNPENQNFFLELFFRNLRLADPETIEALDTVQGEEREFIISYFRDGLANFKFRDKIMESYKQLFPAQEQRDHHLEEMQAVLDALEARISELE